MGDLGDLGEFLKEGTVADLNWLDVEEGTYRKEEVLPKQNLDIQPDLEALWDREGKSSTNYLVPNAGVIPNAPEPHTMGDLSDVHGPLRARAEEIRKVARLALMQSSDLSRFQDTLTKRFDTDSLRDNREVLASALAERGLLGKFYIDAGDFPGCHNSPKTAQAFVRRFAGGAKFVKAKTACGDCTHAKQSHTGGANCAVFHKEIELEVPYSDQLADAVERSQQAKRADALPKERIRLAMLNETPGRESSVYTGQGEGVLPKAPSLSQRELDQHLIQASELVRGKREAAQDHLEALPVLDFLKREMVKGHSEADLTKSLRLAFDAELLSRTASRWGQLFKEAGLYGVVYSTQGSFDECRTGADFFAKHNPGVRAIVAGDKCSGCIYHKVSTCMMYGKKLVKDAGELYTQETVDRVLQEHRTAGRLPEWSAKSASVWGSDYRQALKAIHQATTKSESVPLTASDRLDHMVAFHGGSHEHVANRQTTREIVKQASQYMNEGLYGRDLLKVLKGRFESRDLMAAKVELKKVLAEQGLQGIYFIDPTAYDDFGRGCDKAASLHRSRVVEYVKVADKCSSCVHQRKAGFCSKINKPLVAEPPYTNKRAQQREVLASGKSMDVDLTSLVNNGANMMAEFEMQAAMNVDVAEPVEQVSTAIEFHNGKINL